MFFSCGSFLVEVQPLCHEANDDDDDDELRCNGTLLNQESTSEGWESLLYPL